MELERLDAPLALDDAPLTLDAKLAEIAEWLVGVGYGLDWHTAGNHQLPEILRLPLAQAYWAAEASEIYESVDDFYVMLATELEWS